MVPEVVAHDSAVDARWDLGEEAVERGVLPHEQPHATAALRSSLLLHHRRLEGFGRLVGHFDWLVSSQHNVSYGTVFLYGSWLARAPSRNSYRQGKASTALDVFLLKVCYATTSENFFLSSPLS